MPDHRQRAIPEGGDQPQRVANHVQPAERREVAIVVVVPSGRAPVPSQIGRDDVIPGLGQRHHHVPPAVGQLWEAVEQQQTRSAPALVTGLEHVDAEAVDVVHES